jgi:hypothetical protein
MWWVFAACGGPAPAALGTTASDTPPAAASTTGGAVAPVASTDALAAGVGPGPFESPIRFAVIGDYGEAGPDEEAVAALVASWAPDLIVTTGDNNYPSGSAATIDANIGQYYHAWIGGYSGSYGEGSTDNRFLACLGNHDWYADDGLAAWSAYFDLPHNERYYTFEWGTVLFACIDSDPHEIDGTSRTSVQATWIRDELVDSNARYVIPFFHHPSWSSGTHGSTLAMQWPFHAWGADIVLSGHDHQYERLHVGGLPYVIDGRGGSSLRVMDDRLPTSEVAYMARYGATLGELRGEVLTLTAHTVDGVVVDTLRLDPDRLPTAEPYVLPANALWRTLPVGTAPEAGWQEAGFDDSAWAESWAPIGWGQGLPITDLDPASTPVTTWYRRSFSIEELESVGAVTLDLVLDDGVVVYLNGTEAGRMNLPAGPLTPDTLALVSIGALTPVALSLPRERLLQGENLLAIELHQSSALDPDGWFDASVRVVHTPRLLASGATWRFLDSGVAPVQGWNGLDFDDTAWGSGPSPLGYGVEGLATSVGYGGATASRNAATWFRASFDVSDPAALDAVLLRLQREDGAAVWVNGTEVWRGNLAAAATATDLAGAVLPDGWGDAWIETFVDPGLFVAGANVLAVELHKAEADGEYLRLDAELVPFPGP